MKLLLCIIVLSLVYVAIATPNNAEAMRECQKQHSFTTCHHIIFN